VGERERANKERGKILMSALIELEKRRDELIINKFSCFKESIMKFQASEKIVMKSREFKQKTFITI
jgi:hypothetical protein